MGMKFEKNSKYVSAVSDAMYLWGLHSKRYQTLLDEYNALLEKKKELSLPLKKIKEKDLANYPEIEFLNITSADEAKEYLLDKNPKEIAFICKQIEDMVQTNYVYRTLVSKIDDFSAEIRKKTGPKKDWYAAPIPKAANSAACKRTCAGD